MTDPTMYNIASAIIYRFIANVQSLPLTGGGGGVGGGGMGLNDLAIQAGV